MTVNNRIPIPKNTDKINPIAVSSLILVFEVMYSTSTSEIQPVMKAPPMRKTGFFVPESMKPRQIPGNTAWAIASPTNDFLLRNVNEPTIAELAVSNTDPIATKRMFGSAKEKNSKSEFTFLFDGFFVILFVTASRSPVTGNWRPAAGNYYFASRFGNPSRLINSPTSVSSVNFPPYVPVRFS